MSFHPQSQSKDTSFDMPMFGQRGDSPITETHKFIPKDIDGILQRNRDLQKDLYHRNEPIHKQQTDQSYFDDDLQSIQLPQSTEYGARFMLMAIEITRLSQKLQYLEQNSNVLLMEKQIEGLSETVNHWRELCQSKYCNHPNNDCFIRDQEIDKLRNYYRDTNSAQNESVVTQENNRLKNNQRLLNNQIQDLQAENEQLHLQSSQMDQLLQEIQVYKQELNRIKHDYSTQDNYINDVNDRQVESSRDQKRIIEQKENQQLIKQIKILSDDNKQLQSDKKEQKVEKLKYLSLESEIMRLQNENEQLKQHLNNFKQENEQLKQYLNNSKSTTDQRDLDDLKSNLSELIHRHQKLKLQYSQLQLSLQKYDDDNDQRIFESQEISPNLHSGNKQNKQALSHNKLSSFFE